MMIESSQIIDLIASAIQGAKIEVIDPKNDGRHFNGTVISSLFKGKSILERHQMVMDPLKTLFDSNLHAFSLKTYTPEEWDQKNRIGQDQNESRPE